MVCGTDLLFLVAVDKHLHSAIDKEEAEDKQQPAEAGDKGRTQEDEDTTENDSAEYAPVEHVLVLLLAHAERREYHHHHKKVVHGQCLLYQVARDV